MDSLVPEIVNVGLEIHVGVQIEQELVITICGVTTHYDEWWHWTPWIALQLVVETKSTLYYEEQFIHLDSISVDHLALNVGFLLPNPSGKLDDRFIYEALLTRIKEVPKVASKVCE